MGREHVAICPVCGSGSFRSFLQVKDFTASGEVFQLAKCNSCSLLITSPRPDRVSMGPYYESTQYISHSGGQKNLADSAYRFARKFTVVAKRKLLERFNPPGKVIDYGCGTGEFLEACRKGGWTPAGIEPSPAARQKVPANIPVYPDLSDIIPGVDAITLWHVLEHVHELHQTLADLKKLLNQAGTIFIAVPNPESFDAMHYAEYWAGYDAPRHLWHFNKKNLLQLLEKSGFKLKAILPMKLDSFYVSLLSEHYRSPKSWLLTRFVRALQIAIRSNQKGGKDNYSSLIYIAGL